jgi:putative addiction module killer protein
MNDSQISSWRIEEYAKANGECPFRICLEGLSTAYQARIQGRLLRVRMGNLGDYKYVGHAIYEMRFDFGSGFRIYFAFAGDAIVLLLNGGNKSSQRRDIVKAGSYRQDYLKGHCDG